MSAYQNLLIGIPIIRGNHTEMCAKRWAWAIESEVCLIYFRGVGRKRDLHLGTQCKTLLPPPHALNKVRYFGHEIWQCRQALASVSPCQWHKCPVSPAPPDLLQQAVPTSHIELMLYVHLRWSHACRACAWTSARCSWPWWMSMRKEVKGGRRGWLT